MSYYFNFYKKLPKWLIPIQMQAIVLEMAATKTVANKNGRQS